MGRGTRGTQGTPGRSGWKMPMKKICISEPCHRDGQLIINTSWLFPGKTVNFVSQDSWETKFTVSREISHWWFVIIMAFFVVGKKHCLKNAPSTRGKHWSHHNHVTFCHGLIMYTSGQQCTVTLCCQKMLPAFANVARLWKFGGKQFVC